MLFFRRKLKTINRGELDCKIASFERLGVDEGSDVVVSFTTFPDRICEIRYTLYSLLNQSYKPFKVVLYLSKKEFEKIPAEVEVFLKNGLEVRFCEDICSYKKLIPALRDFGDKLIVTADDDLFYEEDWLERLVRAHEANPDCLVAHRTHRVKLNEKNPLKWCKAQLSDKVISPFTFHISPKWSAYSLAPYKQWKKQTNSQKPSFLNFPTSGAGVLFPPNSLYEDVMKSELFMSLSPKADDVWFWAMAVLKGTRIVSPKKCNKLIYVNPERERGGGLTLFSENKKGGNDKQLKAVLEYYGEVLSGLED